MSVLHAARTHASHATPASGLELCEHVIAIGPPAIADEREGEGRPKIRWRKFHFSSSRATEFILSFYFSLKNGHQVCRCPEVDEGFVAVGSYAPAHAPLPPLK